MAAPRQPRPPWMLPVISAITWIIVMSFLFWWISAVRTLGTVPAVKCGSVRGFRVLPLVVVPVVADEADIHAHKEREHECLDEADQELEEVEGGREAPFLHAAHRMHEALAAEDVAEKPQREGNGPEGDRDDLDDADEKKDQEQRVVDDRGDFLLVGLVSKDVLQHQCRARVAHDEGEPSA